MSFGNRLIWILCGAPLLCHAQADSAQRAISLASTGNCSAAVPLLTRSFAASQGQLAKDVGTAGVKCGMALNDASKALFFLTGLNRRFPHDPAVLYLSTHIYSDLALRTSNELLTTAPGSIEVRELNAESLETMGKWNEAAEEYRSILAKDPSTRGIHYRLGRLLLSLPNASDAQRAEARQQFEAELKVDPSNAGANFVLGELARQGEDWPTAIRYFDAAARNDVTFGDAYLGLGRALVGAGEFQKAVAPLEAAERLLPDNPEVHFQLASVYRKAGRTADAEREARSHREALDRAQAERDNLHRQLTGAPPTPASQ